MAECAGQGVASGAVPHHPPHRLPCRGGRVLTYACPEQPYWTELMCNTCPDRAPCPICPSVQTLQLRQRGRVYTNIHWQQTPHIACIWEVIQRAVVWVMLTSEESSCISRRPPEGLEHHLSLAVLDPCSLLCVSDHSSGTTLSIATDYLVNTVNTL